MSVTSSPGYSEAGAWAFMEINASWCWQLLGPMEYGPPGSKKIKLLNLPRLQQFREVETYLKEPNLASGLQSKGYKPTTRY